MRRAQILLSLAATLAVVVTAQQTVPKPLSGSDPAAKKRAANRVAGTPKRSPSIQLRTATSDGVVTGHTSDPDHMVRITISKEGGEVKTEPAWSEPSGDFTIALLLLKPGWIVQAWVVEGNLELAHSPSMSVVPVLSDDGPQTGAVESRIAPRELPRSGGAATAIDTEATAPRQRPTHPAVTMKSKHQASDTCDEGDADSDAKLQLSDGDSEIQGRTSKFSAASGAVTVCVNGVQRLVTDTSDPASLGGTLTNSKFDVTLASDFKLKEGNLVLVALLTNGGARATIQTTVGPSKTITAAACDSLTKGDQAIQVESGAINAGASEIKGTVPDPPGVVSVCFNNTQVDIAAGPAPAADKPKYSATIPADSNQLDLLLKTPLEENQWVRIAWMSKDKSRRSIKDLQAKPPAFSRVILPTVPKEGETLIKVDTAKPPDGNDKSKSPLSLSVFINQDRVTLLDSKGSDTGSTPVDATGETGLTLKNPVDGGDCVVAIEFSGPSLPDHLDFDNLTCDAKSRVAKAAPTNLGYAQSYPLLANSLFNWGRVRGYMAAGGLFSYDNNNFSEESIFLSFNVTKNWLWGGPFSYYNRDKQLVNGYKRMMFETYFDARLTSLPVAACTSTSSTATTTGNTSAAKATSGTGTTGTTPSSTSSPSCPNSLDTFISTRKSAVLNGGASLPFLISTWNYAHRPYALSLGPLAKVGFNTPISDVQTGSMTASQEEFYTNFGFGARLGLYRMSFSPEVAPEMESYIDVVTGRFSNFDISPTDGSRYARPWRIGIEGVLQVPTTPFILGFGANIHQNFGLFGSKTVDHAKDSLQFLFGAKFDAGKLFTKIGSIK